MLCSCGLVSTKVQRLNVTNDIGVRVRRSCNGWVLLAQYCMVTQVMTARGKYAHLLVTLQSNFNLKETVHLKRVYDNFSVEGDTRMNPGTLYFSRVL